MEFYFALYVFIFHITIFYFNLIYMSSVGYLCENSKLLLLVLVNFNLEDTTPTFVLQILNIVITILCGTELKRPQS